MCTSSAHCAYSSLLRTLDQALVLDNFQHMLTGLSQGVNQSAERGNATQARKSGQPALYRRSVSPFQRTERERDTGRTALLVVILVS